MKHDRRRQTGRQTRQGHRLVAKNLVAINMVAGLFFLDFAPAVSAQTNPAPSPNVTHPDSSQEAGPQWVWSLYADGEPVVLALEIPDTPQLKTTLECEPSSRRVRLSLYDAADLGNGPVTLRSGSQTATGEMQTVRLRLSTSLPSDHPVFLEFLANGEMKLSRGEQVKTIAVGSQQLPLLHRFARACAG